MSSEGTSTSSPGKFQLNHVWKDWKLMILIIVVIIWLYREWSWSSSFSSLTSELSDWRLRCELLVSQLRFERNQVKQVLDLIQQQEAAPEFSAWSKLILNQTNATTSSLIEELSSTILTSKLQSKSRSLFSLSALFRFVCCLALIAYECLGLYELQTKADSTDSPDSSLEKTLLRRMKTFYARYHPISYVLVSGILFIYLVYGYYFSTTTPDATGILPFVSILESVLLWILMFLTASCTFALGFHFWLLSSYLPKTTDAWKSSLKDGSWWIWFVIQLFSVEDQTTAGMTIGWVFFGIWGWWSTFILYKTITSTLVDPADLYFWSKMIMEYLVIIGGSMLFYGVINSLPAFDRVVQEQADEAIFVYRVLNSTYFAVLRVIGHAKFSWTLANAVIALNIVFFAFRIFYFTFWMKSSWTVWLATCGVFHIIIGLVLSVLNGMNLVLNRYNLDQETWPKFQTSFEEGAKNSNVENSSFTDEENRLLLTHCLDRAMLIYSFFPELPVPTETAKDGEEVNSPGYARLSAALGVVISELAQAEADAAKADNKETSDNKDTGAGNNNEDSPIDR